MECLELMVRYIMAILASIIYIVSFGTPSWVEIEDGTSWGLWAMCDNTTTNRKRDCDTIEPNDSDAYYIIAEVLSCFGLVVYVLIWVGLKSNVKTEEDMGCWAFIYFLAAGLTTATVGVIGGYYETDTRWKDRQPELGYSFWLAVTSAIMITIACIGQTVSACKEKAGCDSACDCDSDSDCDSDCDFGCECDCDDCDCCNIFVCCCKKKTPTPKVAPLHYRERRANEMTSSTSGPFTLARTSDPPRIMLQTLKQMHQHERSRRSASKTDQKVPSPSSGNDDRTTPSPPPPKPPSPAPRPLPVSGRLHGQWDSQRRTYDSSVQSPRQQPGGDSPLRPPRGTGRLERSIGGDDTRLERTPRRQEKLSVLSLPQYDLPPLPTDGDVPYVPPPSYHDVVSIVDETALPVVSYPEDLPCRRPHSSKN